MPDDRLDGSWNDNLILSGLTRFRLCGSSVFSVCLMILLSGIPCHSLLGQQKQSQPNIILVYIDDLGYSDLACYGKEYGADFIETPNIDRFAQQSIKFTNAYAAAPLCSPSRAALLTGKTPARLNFEFVTKWEKDKYKATDTAWTAQFRNFKLVPPPYTLNLPLQEKTIPELLKEAGYITAIAGKWHVSSHFNTYNGWNPDYGPARQGFDWTANVTGAWARSNAAARRDSKAGEFPSDSLTDQAIGYIRQKHEKPFFLYLSHYYVHTPIDADLHWLIEKYRQKAKTRGGTVSDKHIRYAAFVETMDHYVGQFLQAVEEAGLLKNSIVVFTSDNGGMPEFSLNRPLRGSKWNLYEGGIRIPLLISAPGLTKASVCNDPVSQVDFLPTFYKIAAAKNYRDQGIDGVDISGLLTGSPKQRMPDRSMVWHFPYYHPEGKAFDTARIQIGKEDGVVSQTRPQSAIRKGKYKLIYYHETGGTELYKLDNDIGEEKDLNEQERGIAKQLKDELLAYLEKVKARFPAKHVEVK
ncbi:sulfatase [Flavitalea sp.]|nr:sulfatase [Flavitalea sp.]